MAPALLGVTVASLVFGQWTAIDVKDIQKPVPEWIQSGVPGSVGPKHTAKPEPAHCHTYGKEISFSLSCAAGSRTGL